MATKTAAQPAKKLKKGDRVQETSPPYRTGTVQSVAGTAINYQVTVGFDGGIKTKHAAAKLKAA